MKLKLLKKTEIAKDTMSFEFLPEKKKAWLPGQYFYLTLENMKAKDSKGPTRDFTIASSPTEEPNLLFAARIRDKSNFKQALKNLPEGTEIEGEGPNGSFILDENEKKHHVMIAGGIGITPLRSIIKYHTDKSTDTKLTLIYSNSSPKGIAFKTNLELWQKQNKNFKLHMTITKPIGLSQNWSGLKGRIDEKMIRALVPELQNATYWLCGPPGMVNAMEDLLETLKIPLKKTRVEKFSGY